MVFVCVQCLCIWRLVMSLHRLACKSASKMIAHCVFTVCVSALYVLWQICQDPALRLCGENWHTGWCGGIDLLHCHLQCWAAVFSMHQPEQWVEPMLVWLVWLGGKWKPLSRFFSLPHPNAKHRREVIWIAKAALAMLIWHWTISIRVWLYTCWLCFVLSCVLKWASLSTVTLSAGRCSTGWVPWWSGLVILVKKKCYSDKPFHSFSSITGK